MNRASKFVEGAIGFKSDPFNAFPGMYGIRPTINILVVVFISPKCYTCNHV